MAFAIDAQHLRKVYRGKVAVEDLSLQVAQGEVFGFLGPNGAGKTTTVKMLLGLVRPSAGSVLVLGGPSSSIEVRRQLGFLPEMFRFQEWMTGEEFLRFHGRLCGLRGAALEARIVEVLNLVGLNGRGQDRLRTYSKGMQQRAGLAQAIIHRPKLVFLDEPTSALDPLGRIEVREIISRLKLEGMTVFLNSHLLVEVEQTCDRVAIVNQGRVVRSGTLQELTQGLELEVRVEHLGDALVEQLSAFGRVLERWPDGLRLALEHQRDVPKIAGLIVQSGAELRALVPRHEQLEDIFVDSVRSSERPQGQA